MDLQDLKKKFIKEELNIVDDFSEIIAFIDFGNVNYWFEEDRQTYDYMELANDEKFYIDIEKLKEFLDIFSKDTRFYYGHDPKNSGSLGFIRKARYTFGKNRVFTKAMQKIRHYLNSSEEVAQNTRELHRDCGGNFIHIPKCNFDVEISVDAIKIIDHYDTFCLLSSDADFVHLARFLKEKGKKIILIKGGFVVRQLKEIADLVINAQDIKKHIAIVKQKPGIKPGSADRKTQIHGQDDLKKVS